MPADCARIAMRPTDQDRRFLPIIAAHLQATRRTPFVAPADAIRAALEIAAKQIATAAQTA